MFSVTVRRGCLFRNNQIVCIIGVCFSCCSPVCLSLVVSCISLSPLQTVLHNWQVSFTAHDVLHASIAVSVSIFLFPSCSWSFCVLADTKETVFLFSFIALCNKSVPLLHTCVLTECFLFFSLAAMCSHCGTLLVSRRWRKQRKQPRPSIGRFLPTRSPGPTLFPHGDSSTWIRPWTFPVVILPHCRCHRHLGAAGGVPLHRAIFGRKQMSCSTPPTPWCMKCSGCASRERQRGPRKLAKQPLEVLPCIVSPCFSDRWGVRTASSSLESGA